MKIFEHIKTFSQQYLVITTFVGIVWGGFVVYDNWKDNNENLNDAVKSIIEYQENRNKVDSLILSNQQELREDFNEHIKLSDDIIKQLQSLQKSYVRYISNDDRLTKTDFVKYMEGLTIEKPMVWHETSINIRKKQ